LQLTPQNYAYLKIAEGCNHNCAFCAIPDIRGHQRSRPIESIVAEAKNLIHNGVYEIILIAQDTTYYGKDLKNGTTIVQLIEALDQIDGEFKIRMLYTHPAFFNDEVIDMFANSKHLLPYIDIPLQHSSDSILKKMRRPTNEASVRTLLSKIKSRVKEATIRTTFIVGYPGESEEDYQNLKQFILDMQFDRMGVFAFSPEKGTDAATESDPVDPQIAQARVDELMQFQAEIALQKNVEKVGKTIEVFIDGMDDEFILGRSFGDAPEVDNLVLIEYPEEECELPPMVRVKIISAETYELVGVLA
jgi:ribosomal protein S12 methylthiotransferase